MKQIILVAVVALIGLIAVSAEAGIKTCGDNHAVWSADNTKIVNCIAKDIWENQLAEAQQRRIDDLGGNLKVIPQGKVFWDVRGFENGCAWWYPMHCVVKPEWFGAWR